MEDSSRSVDAEYVFSFLEAELDLFIDIIDV